MKRLQLAKWSSICLCVLFGTAMAQINQDASDSGVNIAGNNEGFINTGQIRIVLNSEAQLTEDPLEQRVLEHLSAVLIKLVEQGEISVSEKAVRVLARDAIGQLSRQPLTRDVIQERQFSVPYQQTYNIAGTNNRITFLQAHCYANLGIRFRFNKDEYCWYGVGGTLEFVSDGNDYELVFDGYDEKQNAKFTIYAAN